MSRADSARLLLDKAHEDRDAARVLAASDHVTDAVVGFHAQQAAEKALKAVLVMRGVEYRRSHDLSYLGELLESSGLALGDDLAGLDELTPFAVQLRYERPHAVDVDRPRAIALAEATCAWAASQIRA